MQIKKTEISKIFTIFLFSHLIIWTVVPSLLNNNLPLDTIEHIAWGNGWPLGWEKHPPLNVWFPELFYQIFGSQDWSFYLLSQIFVVSSFIIIFKFSQDFFKNQFHSLISVLLLESIFFYNFTTPEFNVNVCQLPFWSLVVYFSWKIYSSKEIKLSDCFCIGLFGAIGFLSKYLFVYLLASIFLLFTYLVFIKKDRKFDFKYFIILEVFIVLLVPHLVWLYGNDFITIFYGLKRTGLEPSLINHFEQPIFFLIKQLGILLPFFFLIWLLVKKIKFKLNINDKKLLFLLAINLLPVFLILLTSAIMGSKIRTMWMTPFYLFFGVLFIYVLKSQINIKRTNSLSIVSLLVIQKSVSIENGKK